LKLENGETVIYVKGRRFSICKHLVFNIRIDKISSFNEIQSIDEVSDIITNLKAYIPPETEFWGHCSNLQVWYENDYNTKLLHRNLAFPLLKRLTELGEIKAKRIFKEEVAKRFLGGHQTTSEYLYKEGYLQSFTTEELEFLIQDCFSRNLFKSLTQKIILDKIKRQFPAVDEFRYYIEKDKIVEITISRKDHRIIKNSKDIFCLQFLTYLKILSLHNFENVRMCDFEVFKELERLKLSMCNLTEIKCLNNFNNLETLELDFNMIKEINDLDNLTNLTKLSLYKNQIEEIKNLNGLTNLKELILADNKIKVLKGVNDLKNLKTLRLDFNEISEIKELNSLNNLEYLNLCGNQIEDISNLKLLNNLKELDLRYNKIKNVEALKNLSNLNHVKLRHNEISELEIKEILKKNK
jgi:Leucine-rich repeat (LRR) protein